MPFLLRSSIWPPTLSPSTHISVLSTQRLVNLLQSLTLQFSALFQQLTSSNGSVVCWLHQRTPLPFIYYSIKPTIISRTLCNTTTNLLSYLPLTAFLSFPATTSLSHKFNLDTDLQFSPLFSHPILPAHTIPFLNYFVACKPAFSSASYLPLPLPLPNLNPRAPLP